MCCAGSIWVKYDLVLVAVGSKVQGDVGGCLCLPTSIHPGIRRWMEVDKGSHPDCPHLAAHNCEAKLHLIQMPLHSSPTPCCSHPWGLALVVQFEV